MSFADILVEYLFLFLVGAIINLIWRVGSRLYRKRSSPHMKLEPLRSDINRALLTAALAPIFGKIIGALLFYVAALL